MKQDSAHRTIAIRLVGLLIRLYPSEFRHRFGESILDDFRTRYMAIDDRAGAHRSQRRLALTIRTAVDILRAATAERFHGSVRPDRSVNGVPWWRRFTHGVFQDTRYAFRSLRRQPFFSSVIVLTLATGIGTNAAIFSLVSNVLWQRLPYPEPDELVSTWTSNLARGINRWGVSLHDLTDWRERTDVFQDLGAFNVNTTNLSGIDQPRRIVFAQVTPGFFTTFSTPPAIGRFFEEDENLPGRDRVVILSHGFWRESFAARTEIVGQTITIDGAPMTVVGIMPEGFAFPTPDVQLWKPFGMLPEDEGGRGGRWVRAIGRLKPGVPLESARASLATLGSVLAAEYPETNEGFGIYIEPLLATATGGVRSALLVLWGATSLVLLIVCANVANMMVARATTRSRETAVRTALGASRFRLLRQLLAEGIPLTLTGGLLGVMVASLVIRLFPVILGSQVPRLQAVNLDAGVLAYSVGVALVVGALFSVLPAIRESSFDVSSALRDSRGTSLPRSAVRARSAIVVIQISLAMTIVIGAGLMVRSLSLLLETDPGFDHSNILTFRISPSWSEMPERAEANQLFDRMMQTTRALPGVAAVSAVNSLPLTGNSWNTQVRIPGAASTSEREGRGLSRVILPGYHETMGIPLVRGRLFDASDDAGSTRVVIINQAAADAWFAGESPIGALVHYDGPDPRTIVGVVGNVEAGPIGSGVTPLLYAPFPQGRFGHFQNWGMSFVVRTTTDAVEVTPSLIEQMTGIVGQIPLFSVQTMDDIVAGNVSTQRLYTRLLLAFGVIALLLATVGVYSVISYLVAQRRREIGVRIALGAAHSRVLRLVLRRALLLAAVGIVIGGLVASFVSRALTGFLYQTAVVDPATYLVVAVTFTLAVLLASLEPAVRAMRVDPVRALKSE